MSALDRRIDRRRSSGSLGGADSAQSSPRTSSLPPTPPSASDAHHADRVALAAPIQPFLPPTSPPTPQLAARRDFDGDDMNDISHSMDTVSDPIEEILKADAPPLPSPRSPASCPIFCCFYAEFDIVRGPMVAFQSPQDFMDQDTGISTEAIHELLRDTFERVKQENERKEMGESDELDKPDDSSAAKGADSTQTRANMDDDSIEPSSLSIFDATSEYIITGNELAGKMINLSTHNMHILTRPTAISDERYERNALLFSVGFVLSRKEDPRPFRPLLCRWADALRSMEVENHFLTDPTLRIELQPMLDRLLVSLNSTRYECNLLLDSANALNLRAFRPPKPPALPVPDYAVPILVREDLLSLYDWDLAITWMSMFISGVDHARWIAIKSDVDMEMVRACLRVLKHHGIIALADMFFYSNRYEFTERASAMLAGKEPKLLQEALEYVSHLHQRSNSNTPPLGETAPPGLAVPALSSSVGRHSDGVPFLPGNEATLSFPPRKTSIGSSLLSTREVPRSNAARQQQKKMKLALAELYCSCNRNLSFGDMLVSKVASSSSSGSSVIKRGSSRGSTASSNAGGAMGDLEDIQESLGEDRVVTLSSAEPGSSVKKMFSPVSASSFAQRETKGWTDQGAIDWNEVFEFFDHRRFATFGVVHGLLRRVHNFPRAVDIRRQESEAAEDSVSSGNSVNYTHKSVDPRRASFRSMAMQNGTIETTSSTVMASRVAAMMDGTKCDDELVCEFEKPLDELVGLVETSGTRKVMSIYSL